VPTTDVKRLGIHPTKRNSWRSGRKKGDLATLAFTSIPLCLIVEVWQIVSEIPYLERRTEYARMG
ncbi:MAG: hypothetical protein QF516_14800, partial [Pirellulaceae bacterium]|nr:hypothetical protein [Pirellulaceae bacterium]